MSKYVAPSHMAMVVVDGIEYEPDADGVIEARTRQHAEQFALLGIPEFDPANTNVRPLAPEEKLSVLSDENLILQARIRELEDQAASRPATTDASGAPLGAAGAIDAAQGPGGPSGALVDGTTSSVPPQGQSGDLLDKDDDKLKAAIAAAPNVDDPNVTRDQMVLWLASVGTSVPGNIARDKAVTIVKDKVAGLNDEADKLAGEARAEAEA